MPNWLVKVLQVIIAMTLPLVLLIGNLQIVAHMRFINFEYDKASFPADTAIPPGGYALAEPERRALAETALKSIIGPEGMRALEQARFVETGGPAFNAREIRHMRDVRRLFQFARVIFGVGLIASVTCGGALAWWSKRTGQGSQLITHPILISVIVTLAVAAALGAYILLSFRSFFTQFHHVFFQGDTWLFRADDTLIRLFPTDFWFDAAIAIAGLTVAEFIAMGIAAWWRGRKGG
jgi:integral membrane protein (TIGR01906 family)